MKEVRVNEARGKGRRRSERIAQDPHARNGCRTVLCFCTLGRVKRGGRRVLVRGAYNVDERRCGRSKFVEQRIDF